MSVDHYENFPVASLLLPPALRGPVAAIYHFARGADDIADEGNSPAAERRMLLLRYKQELDAIAAGNESRQPVFQALKQVLDNHDLPVALFHDLLNAFLQDVEQDRYADFVELMDYCRRSADPVGRLLLHLFGHDNAENLAHSDAVCSALQLINHWQDVGIDAEKGDRGRIYLPQDDMARFGVTDEMILRRAANPDFRALLRFQVDRAREMMNRGAPLGWRLPGRIGLEIRAIVAGGLCILDKIEAADFDVFAHRPVLGKLDWPGIFWRVLVRPA